MLTLCIHVESEVYEVVDRADFEPPEHYRVTGRVAVYLLPDREDPVYRTNSRVDLLNWFSTHEHLDVEQIMRIEKALTALEIGC